MTIAADPDLGDGAIELSPVDRWIISKCQKTISLVRESLDTYRFDLAVQAIYDFAWYQYCDWYLEMSKPMQNRDLVKASIRRGTQNTLVCMLETILRLLHPMMPFITEELWQQIAPLANMQGDTIMLAPYPQAEASLIDLDAEKNVEWLMQLITQIRNIRGEMNVPPSRAIRLLLQNGTAEDRVHIEKTQNLIEALAKINLIEWLSPTDQVPAQCAASVLGSLDIYVPLAGLIDLGAERQRLEKELAKTQSELDKCTTKLSNEGFTSRAPAEVVEQEKQRAAEFLQKVEGLKEKVANLR
jgi:valyl-tRNA synthetase